ncbi:Signal peptidase I [hydrothermal vent metagenome]|uniref:signal peptidase I n=1 Tax=hydrothermal vent metagenome TaxID=652676 RepID=A0A3B0YUB2_9ZZZZ
MNFNFPAILVGATFATGLIWLIDAVLLAPKRKRAAAALDSPPLKEPTLVEYAKSFFPVILAVLLLRSFLIEPFRIPSGSMMPTLLVGDFILVNKYAYGIRLPVLNKKVYQLGDPARGDVVVFRFPKQPSVDYIKRVIGVPGDRIAYKNKTLYINGEKIAQVPEGTYVGVGSGLSSSGADLRREDLMGVKHDILVVPGIHGISTDAVVPDGHYFVMGDNRDNSNDSRYWGFVPDENLVGKAFMIWMNWDSAADGIGWDRIGDSID